MHKILCTTEEESVSMVPSKEVASTMVSSLIIRGSFLDFTIHSSKE